MGHWEERGSSQEARKRLSEKKCSSKDLRNRGSKPR